MSTVAAYELVEVDGAAGFAAARVLFEEYATQLGVDLCFQDFAFELDHLAEMYAPPSGCLLLAKYADATVGCGAMRSVADGVCEMKRLYVRSDARGAALGRRLAVGLVGRARELGYQRMVLDTLADMKSAQALYRSLGFRDIPPYYSNPMPGVTYMALNLRPAAP